MWKTRSLGDGKAGRSKVIQDLLIMFLMGKLGERTPNIVTRLRHLRQLAVESVHVFVCL